MGAREWFLLVLLSLLWGGSFYFFKVLVTELPPFTIVLARVFLAALLLNVLILIKGDSLPTAPRAWGRFMIMGLLNNLVPFLLIVWAEIHISSGLASILNATTPIFAVLAAHFLTVNEKLSWRKGVGVMFGFLGVVVLVGPTVFAKSGRDQIPAEAACLLGALIYAFAGIYGRRFRAMPALIVATGQITASTVMILPFTLMIDRPWTLQNPAAHTWAAMMGLVVMSTALAYVIYFRILATAGATNVLLVTFLVPISAILLGVMFLNEAFTLHTLGGMILIGLGLAAIDGRLPAAIRRRP